MPDAKFIHISDIHFQSKYSPTAKLLINHTGADFTEQFKTGMKYIRQKYSRIDFFIITGDLVHEGTEREYYELRRLLHDTAGEIPVYTVPGNHDRNTYGSGFLGIDDPPFDMEYIHSGSNLTILALDSRGGKFGSGQLTGRQLRWLSRRLGRENGRDIILMMHHTPHISGNIEFLIWQMENPGPLHRVIRDSGVLAIFCGHTHKAFVSKLGDIPCYTAGSITHGIDCGLDSMTFTNQTGFHYCVYEDGNISTEYIDIPADNDAKVVIPYSAL